MNRYLLLRDNKQSGPYTVNEIISNGIKPYDLVWLEGKSAAWRYPSEIAELKAHSPTIEEQPFDRFYKKPGPVAENHETFEPKVSEAKELRSQNEKVYVNFPASVQKQRLPKAEITEVKIPAPTDEVQAAKPSFPEPDKKEIQTPVYPIKEKIDSQNTPVYNMHQKKNNYSESTHQAEHIFPASKKSDNKLLYGFIAACFFLLIVVSYLVVNYNNQKNDIKELNSIVQKMGQREKEQQASFANNALNTSVENTPEEIPPVPASEAAAVTANEIAVKNPEINNAQPKKITVEKPIKTISQPENSARKTEEPGVVFTPSAREKIVSTAANTGTDENLFKLVSVKPNKYKTGLLGGISNLQLELTNNSKRELHKVAVEIKFLGPEKKVVKTQTVYFENISPGAQLKLDVPKSSRGVTIDYSITDIKS